MGFNGRERDPLTEQRDGYVGRFICIQQNGNSVLGILKNIDELNKLAYLQPSIVGFADDTLYVEESLPTRIRIPLGIIRPMKGTVEDYVKVYNKNAKAKAKKGEQSK